MSGGKQILPGGSDCGIPPFKSEGWATQILCILIDVYTSISHGTVTHTETTLYVRQLPPRFAGAHSGL